MPFAILESYFLYLLVRFKSVSATICKDNYIYSTKQVFTHVRTSGLFFFLLSSFATVDQSYSLKDPSSDSADTIHPTQPNQSRKVDPKMDYLVRFETGYFAAAVADGGADVG